jgi:DNA polymerase III subunit delta
MTAKTKEKYTVARLNADMKNGEISPLYLFYGPEDFLIEGWINSILKKSLQPGDEDFNLDILYGNETDGASIVNVAMSFPMMAERRLVIVKEFHHLKEKCIKLISTYMQKPSGTSCLVLASSKFTSTNAVIKSWSKLCRALEAKPLYDNHVPPWIRSHVKERGLTIADDAINLLQMNAGNSLRRLASEIDKIELVLKDRREVAVEDVESVVGASKEFNVFEFADAVSDKNQPKSLRILHRLLELGESPIGMLVMLNRQYTIIVKAKELSAASARKDEMSRALRVNPYFVEKYVRQAGKYNRNQLGDIMQLLLTADQHLKSSYQKPKLILESLIFEINAL